MASRALHALQAYKATSEFEELDPEAKAALAAAIEDFSNAYPDEGGPPV